MKADYDTCGITASFMRVLLVSDDANDQNLLQRWTWRRSLDGRESHGVADDLLVPGGSGNV